jgi:hypothetical protein
MDFRPPCTEEMLTSLVISRELRRLSQFPNDSPSAMMQGKHIAQILQQGCWLHPFSQTRLTRPAVRRSCTPRDASQPALSPALREPPKAEFQSLANTSESVLWFILFCCNLRILNVRQHSTSPRRPLAVPARRSLRSYASSRTASPR